MRINQISKLCSLIGCIVAALFLAFVASAQLATADVLGTVTDATGASVPGAVVTLTNTGTNISDTTRSGPAGAYLFSLVKPGVYSITITATGFETFRESAVEVAAGDRRRIDTPLLVGASSTSVNVVADAASLQTDSATLNNVVGATQVQDIPLNGRNVIGLIQVMPGASLGPSNGESSGARPDDRRQSNEVSVNGQRTQLNNELIDGLDNNERIIGAIGVRPSIDGIAEVNVQTNDYSAEVGRTSGAVVNIITKSGENHMHGSAFEFLRNNIFDANDWFAKRAGQRIAEFRQNQFGGSFGGPIRRDKTFFFADYEGLRIVQGIVRVSTIPTVAERSGDFSALLSVTPDNTSVVRIYDPTTAGSSATQRAQFVNNKLTRIDPVAQNLINTLPAPTASGLANNYTTTLNQTYYGNTADARIDHHFSEKDTIYSRFTVNNVQSYIPGQFPVVNGLGNAGNTSLSNGPASAIDYGVGNHYTHTFRSNLLLDLGLGFMRFNNFAMPQNGRLPKPSSYGFTGADGADAFPQFTFTGYGNSSIGDASFVPLHRVDNNYQYTGTLVYTHGNQTFKFGGSYIRRFEAMYAFAGGGAGAGTFGFDGRATNVGGGGTSGGNSIASFLLGYPASGGIRTLSKTGYYNFREYGMFAEDDWHAAPWLTLNMGLRYDIMTPPSEKYNRTSNFNFATGQIVQSGTNGVNRNAGIETNYGDISPRIGFAASLPGHAVLRGGYGISYWSDITGVTFGSVAQSQILTSTPYASFNVDSSLPPNVFLGAGFSPLAPQTLNPVVNAFNGYSFHFKDASAQGFNLTFQKLIGQNSFSLGYVGILSRHLFVQINRNLAPLGSTAAIQSRRPYYSIAPLATNIVERSMQGTASYHALQAVFSRRLSHGLTFNSNFTWSHSINDVTDAATGGTSGGNSGLNQVTNFQSKPYGDLGNADTDAPLLLSASGNYKISYLDHFKSLLARETIGNWQVNTLVALSSGLPFTVYNATPVSNTGLANDRPNVITNPRLQNRSPAAWFNTAAFQAQTPTTLGNATRNILRGPSVRHLDLSLFHQFEITEQLHAEFRIESFNLTNTPSFGIPIAALGASNFGSITNLQPQTTPRQIQFAMKLLF